MNAQTENFWPPDIGVKAMITPVVILREQASILASKTKGLVEGRVSTHAGPEGRIRHSFELVAPVLGGYRYELFRISHSVLLYPVTVEANSTIDGSGETALSKLHDRLINTYKELNDEEAFKNWLKQTLSSQHTGYVVDSLLAQSVATS